MNEFHMTSMAWWGGTHWLMMLLGSGLVVWPFWRIFAKAGFSGWFSLLMLVPMINLIALYVLAFADWPNLGRADGVRSTAWTRTASTPQHDAQAS